MQRSLWLLAVLLVAVAAIAWWRFNTGSGAGSVVVYVSHDQVFSEPILKDFERETGIKVRAVYDTEETKSTGTMNRLIAEKNNPQADVYWANEPVRAEVLRQRNIAARYRSPNAEGVPVTFRGPQDYWTGFAARARVLIVRKDENPKPASVFAYSDPRWRDKAVIANPLFGTTTDQVAALFVLLGDERARNFLQSCAKMASK
jgi:iron(III) transport system substrate-binding protein